MRSPFLSLILCLQILDFHFGLPCQSVSLGAQSRTKTCPLVLSKVYRLLQFIVVLGVYEDAESIFNTNNVIV